MVQRVFSVFMAFLFLLIVTQRAVIIVHFKLNQKAIEQKFCINKDKPELQCQGLCYLKKELQKTENNDLETISFYKDFEMISVARFEFDTKVKQTVIGFKTILYKVFFPLDPCLEIFTPPPDYYSGHYFKYSTQIQKYS